MKQRDMPLTDDTVMTLAEVASFLKLGQRTILKMVHDQEIPAIRIGNQWRFMSSMIHGWLGSKVEGAPKDALTRLMESTEGSVPISRLIVPHYLALDIRPGTPEDVLDQLTKPLVARGGIDALGQKRFVEGLLARESMRSTVVSDGIAFPHLRDPNGNPAHSPFIQIGRCLEGTDFGSPDGKPVFVFGLVCTSSIVVHLRLLAALSQAVSAPGFMQMILGAESADAILAGFLELEQKATFGGIDGHTKLSG